MRSKSFGLQYLIYFHLIVALFLMTVIRLFLLLQNGFYFMSLQWSQILFSIVDGIRFDLSILLIFCGVFLLLSLVPLANRRYYLALQIFFVSFFQPLLLLLLADLAFFKESKFHITNQLLIIGDDLIFIFELAFKHYWGYLLLWFFGYIVWIWLSILGSRQLCYSRQGKGYALSLLFTLLLLYFGINGKIGFKIDRMISTSDAFSGGSVVSGNLVLNGGFTSFQVIRDMRKKNKTRTVSRDEARNIAIEYLNHPSLKADTEYPLAFSFRTYNSPYKFSHRPNILIIMLESWSSKYIDSFSRANHKLSITPHFDKLASNGLKFNNFYPNGSMSLYGASAILTSLPPFSRMPVLGKGAEVYNLMRVGDIFNKMGYRTFVAQSSIRVSFRLNSIANYLGFSQYFGKEDYPRIYGEESPTNGWDGETFSFLKTFLPQQSKPFFGFIFTGTTHIPYQVPDPKFLKYPHDDRELNGFYNTLFYADAMLGEFMQWSQQQDWFDDTIFVFVADHTLDRSVSGEESKIPLLLYAPKYIPVGESNVLGSQIDIIPTLFDLLHLNAPYYGVGRSLFLPGEKVVFNESSQRLGIITEHGESLLHDRMSKIDSNFSNNERQEHYQQLLLGIEQFLIDTIERNRIAP